MDSIEHRNGIVEPCTGTATSESTIPSPSGAEEEFTSESTMALDDDAKSSSRPSRASRQTVQDLEAKAHQSGDKKGMMCESLSRVSLQPGAVAMYRSDSGSTASSAAPSNLKGQDASTNCRSLGEEEEAHEIPMIHVELAVDHTSTPMMIQAELAEDPPETVIAIPEAQLVSPPQEAYHVQFDEETPSPLEMAQRPSTTNHAAWNDLPWKTNRLWEEHGKSFFRLGVLIFRLGVLLLVMGLIAGAVPWWEMLQGESQVILAGPSAPTPSPSHQTVYECYDSTLKIALAQADNPSKTQFIICPNTLIPLGNLNHDREIENGDYPLTVLGNNIEIRCGLSGKRENHCILEGGFVQVLLQPSLPGLLAEESVNRTDNVIFRGITFKGELKDDNDMMGGVSVLVDNPGQNITFVDCAWENIAAPSSLVQIGDINDAMTFAPTTHVTFEDCTFSNIAYSRPLIGVYGQAVTLRRCLFEDLSVPLVMEQPCPVQDSLPQCQGLLYCFERSSCELDDVCAEGLDYSGATALATVSQQANLTVSGAQQSYCPTLNPSDLSSVSNTTSVGSIQEP